jgi:hypothetical protein
LAADLENLDLDFRVDVRAFADDEDFSEHARTVKASIHPKGATEAQFAHETGAFTQETRDFSQVAALRTPPILASPLFRHSRQAPAPLALSTIQDDEDIAIGRKTSR